MKAACKDCPFRVGAEMGYDEDAIIALSEGNEPSCHMVVGREAIFAHAPMSPARTARCRGHDKWISGAYGYAEPQLSKEPTE